MPRFTVCLLACVAAAAVSAAVPKASAGKAKPAAAKAVRPQPAPGPVQTAHRRSQYVGAISVDAVSGRVLFEDNADAEAYPASVTKLMTLLLVLEDVEKGRYGLDDMVTATADAYRSEPSWVGIKAGEKMSVRSLLMALMVESANDAAIVLGVHSAGSFDGFVTAMNSRAAELGMKRTRYYNPNGLPPNAQKRYPWKSFNVTTARDQMLLAREIVRHPVALEFTSVKTCSLVKTSYGFRTEVTRRVNEPVRETKLEAGERIDKTLCNHNNVMVKDERTLRRMNDIPKIVNPDGTEAVDGLKTGFINAGGSSVVLTGRRGGKRAIAVVLGSSGPKERDAHAARLLEDALSALAW